MLMRAAHYRCKLVSCTACGIRDYTESHKVGVRELPAVYHMTKEQRIMISKLPIVTLFGDNGESRRQALAPVFSCFPAFRNVFLDESMECYQLHLRNDETPRYHLHADLVHVAEVCVLV